MMTIEEMTHDIMRATPYHSFEEHCEAVTWMAMVAVMAVLSSRKDSVNAFISFTTIPISAERVASTSSEVAYEATKVRKGNL
jgi:hypothetical protein